MLDICHLLPSYSMLFAALIQYDNATLVHMGSLLPHTVCYLLPAAGVVKEVGAEGM